MKENQNATPASGEFLGDSVLESASGDHGGLIQRKAPDLFGGDDTPIQRQPTPEENRATATYLSANGGGQNGNVHITADFQAQVTAFETAARGAQNVAALRAAIQTAGTSLWTYATNQIRTSGSATHNDDRPVHIARLRMRTIIRNHPQAGTHVDALINLLEDTSRGRTSSQINFTGTAGNLKILISGYDPYGSPWVNPNIDRSNPSGATAMLLDGTTVATTDSSGNARTAEIQAVTFPVRYGDFDQGVVERVFAPYLSGPNAVNMIITLSLGSGAPNRFDIEGYATQNRGGARDNNMVSSSGAAPQAPNRTGANPNYVMTTLPWYQIISSANLTGQYSVVLDKTYQMAGHSVAQRQQQLFNQSLAQALQRLGITDATYRGWLQQFQAGTLQGQDLASYNQVNTLQGEILTDLRDDTISRGDLGTSTTPGDYFSDAGLSSSTTMSSGSGGDYLSNEIMYRTGRLAGQLGSTVPYGHIHLPSNMVNQTYQQSRNGEIAAQVRQIIIAAGPSL